MTDRAGQADSPAIDSPRSDPAPQRERAWSSGHPVNIRLSVPFFTGRCYLTIVAGRERRCPSRRDDERNKHPLATAGNITFMALLGTLLGVGSLAAIHQASIFLLQ